MIGFAPLNPSYMDLLASPTSVPAAGPLSTGAQRGADALDVGAAPDANDVCNDSWALTAEGRSWGRASAGGSRTYRHQ